MECMTNITDIILTIGLIWVITRLDKIEKALKEK